MATNLLLDDPYLPLAFSLYSNPGAYAVLAGAGVSRGAGLPTAWDIVVDLVDQIAQQSDDSSEINPVTAAPWYEARFGQTPSYSEIVERLALTPTERQSLLKGYFEASLDGDRPGPSLAHRSIAKLMAAGIVRVTVTMNFDRHLERALRELDIEPSIVATEADAVTALVERAQFCSPKVLTRVAPPMKAGLLRCWWSLTTHQPSEGDPLSHAHMGGRLGDTRPT